MVAWDSGMEEETVEPVVHNDKCNNATSESLMAWGGLWQKKWLYWAAGNGGGRPISH